MKKLKTVIQYECITAFKYIWLFYIIQYTIVALITVIVAIRTGSLGGVGTNYLEVNTLIYIGIVAVQGFKEDFKMLIQNGFTRKYIFLALVSLFAFISGIMSFVDTMVGNVLHYIVRDYDYSSLFGDIYGYKNMFANWIYLFFVYLFICSLFYFGILVVNKIGKTVSIYLGIILGGFVLLIVALFQYVLSNELVNNLAEVAMKAMGFMKDGTIHVIFPILTLFLFIGVLSICSYHIILRTELKS